MANEPSDKPADEGEGTAQAQAGDAPRRERRASYRVGDDQKSGEGSLTALSKLKMIERKLAAWRAMRGGS